MITAILKIALLCIVIGSASIPLSFRVSDSVFVVWLGNAIGSLASAVAVIFIGDRITSEKFRKRVSKRRLGKKVVGTFEEGEKNTKVAEARGFINKHGLRIFSFLCPIFPGVLLSAVAVYALDLDKKIFKRWMLAGVIFASGLYVYAYWRIFVR